jgi:hypothetical protein
MDEIVKGWRGILGNKIKIDIASVFCHQRPLITFATNGPDETCEIADVLFLHCHKNIFGLKSYNAVLFQAKKDNGKDDDILMKLDAQLKLYTKWPEFRYGKRNAKVSYTFSVEDTRLILPSRQHKGARYLVFPRDPSYTSLPVKFMTAKANRILKPDKSFSEELDNLIIGIGGRSVKKRNVRDIWFFRCHDLSKVIKEIINKINLDYQFTNRQLGSGQFPRLIINGDKWSILNSLISMELYDFAMFIRLADLFHNLDDGGGKDYKNLNGEGESDGNGFSVVTIVTQSLI